MRLVEQAAVLEVRHHIADRRRAEHLLKPLGNRARRHWLARLDVHAHDIRENLAVASFLQRGIPHSSTLLLVPKSATYHCRKPVKQRQRELEKRLSLRFAGSWPAPSTFWI